MCLIGYKGICRRILHIRGNRVLLFFVSSKFRIVFLFRLNRLLLCVLVVLFLYCISFVYDVFLFFLLHMKIVLSLCIIAKRYIAIGSYRLGYVLS